MSVFIPYNMSNSYFQTEKTEIKKENRLWQDLHQKQI